MGNKTTKYNKGSGTQNSSLQPLRKRKQGQWSLSASMDGGPVLRKSSSSGCLRDHSIEDVSLLRDRSASESQGARRPSRDKKLRSRVSASAQALINSSFENAHEDTARRVYSRITQTRPEYANFWKALSREDQTFMAESLKTYLTNVVTCVDDTNEIKRLSEEFGARHVQLRLFGFKPDFFATTADAVTTECVFLDHAVHPTSETFKAWTELITLMFSSVRDGYYTEVRRIRRQSYCFKSQVRHSSFELTCEPDSEPTLSYSFDAYEDPCALRERIIPAKCLSVVTEERGDCQIRADFGGLTGLPRNSMNNA